MTKGESAKSTSPPSMAGLSNEGKGTLPWSPDEI